jgi:cytochrome c
MSRASSLENSGLLRVARPGIVGALLAFGVVPTVFSADVATLMTQKRCDACHDLTATRIGPPYVAIALRHRADKDNLVEVLARKIVLGGGGNWGVVPMVPNEHVTLDEARVMAKWILERPAG